MKAASTVWTTSTQLYRRDEVVLTRLRIAHTIHTHGHFMEGGPPALCCGQPPSVVYILSELIAQYLPNP
jgi:hypothetical protein